MTRNSDIYRYAAAVGTSVLFATTFIATAESTNEAFATENSVAMDRMMSAMQIKSSGDIDRDFAAMMIPHHRGAIDMAQSELRYGQNEQLRRIAQEIIVDQLQEIDAMNLALDRTAAAPVASANPMHHHSQD
ncbi:hypothetical protein BH10PSE17_BH10PSE17_15870 [soil metagenome]